LVAAGEAAPPSSAPTPGTGGRKKTLVLVIVAVLVIAALASVTYILLSRTSPPATPPAAVRLDHVTISGGTSVDQAGLLTLSAVAIDTKGAAETSNATWLWSASPAASVTVVMSGTPSTIQVLAKLSGSVTITANATWNNSAKESTHAVTVNALTYELIPADTAPLVGQAFDITVRVLRGATIATSYAGTVHFTSDDTGATIPADAAFSAGDAGQKIVSGFAVSVPSAVQFTGTDTVAAITGSAGVSGNRAPIALITLTPDSANPLGMTADGSGSSDPDGDPITYLWDLGDSTTATTPVVTHTYATAGPYLVQLTVTDSHAVSDSATQTFTAKAKPTASFIVVSESPSGTGIRVDVDASASSDSDGTIVNYNWTWDDGTFSDVSTPVTFHDYGASLIGQSVTIVLRVTDNDNLDGRASQTIQITLLPQPPVASFVVSSVDQLNRTVYVDASGSSDPNGNIASYNWSWGDGTWTNLTTATASHAYGTDADFVINLTVIDTTSLSGSTEMSVHVEQPSVAPTAVLTVTRNLMTVDADASASFDPNGNIATYTFAWGDGTTTGPQASPLASHVYSSAGKYTVTVTVEDSTNLQGSAAKTVSVAASTLDYRYHDFFNVPYGEWWDYRYIKYGDLPINAECFNQTSVADGVCTPNHPNTPDFETYPYTNWYPLPGSIRPGNPTNNPLVYAPYLFDVAGVNVAGYNRSEPVFLPVFNYDAPVGSELNFHWYLQYLDKATGDDLTLNKGCPGVDPKFNDGFEIRSQVWLTLDLAESKRIFGVPLSTTPSQAQAWWNSNTNNACGTQGLLEDQVSSWFQTLGGPAGTEGKYDIVNSFEYQYTPFYTNITAVVDSSTGETRVYLEHAAWGTEVLLARMFYWGNASYQLNYLDSTNARGWWGMELGWLEGMNFQGSLGPAGGGFDFNLSAAMQYHFQQLTFPRTGGYDRTDDVPYWTWGPILSDYTNDYSPKHPISELDRYPSPYYGYIHSTPGSARYGQNLTYDYVPIRWDLVAGQTWNFQYPTGNVVFYDPNNTPLGSDPRYGAYVEVHKPLAYDSTKPSGYGTWDVTNNTWGVYGPSLTGGPVGNAGADGIPGNSDDRYALESWGAINVVASGAAGFAKITSHASAPPALGPSSESAAAGSARSGDFYVATVPSRVTTRSRLD